MITAPDRVPRSAPGSTTGPLAPGVDPDVWTVLVMVAELQGPDGEPDARVALLSREDFDHGRLVEQAMRHRLIAALADFLVRHGLLPVIPARLRYCLVMYLRTNRHRTEVYTAEAARVSRELASAGVTAAWTKGVIAQELLYGGSAVRMFNDIDLMIAPQDRSAVQELLPAIGYVPDCVWDEESARLVPRSRTDLRIYQLSPDHLPHFNRIGPDPVMPYTVIDVANSLTWHGSPWQVPMDTVMSRTRTVERRDGESVPALSAGDSFLFTCLHLFREGWLDRFARAKGLSLSQFGDVLREWTRLTRDERRALAGEIAALGLAEPVAWVSGHTDAVFGSDITAGLGLGEYANEAWLAGAMGANGKPLRWSGDMRAWLTGRGTERPMPQDDSADHPTAG
ncbi:nucleotidyltransferase family protein [Streptomyces sp. NPDC051569]|uniref:nucleotidyltransferase family protein n=1 Tax=Streptomyces sp. NPDC051569 TaxID=3365661 RepID=UPI0037B92FB6